MIKPLRGYVLVQPLDEEEKLPSGLIVPDSAKDKPMKGRVVAVGASLITKNVQGIANGGTLSPEVGINDIVYYKKWANETVKNADGEFLFVKFEDLMGVEE